MDTNDDYNGTNAKGVAMLLGTTGNGFITAQNSPIFILLTTGKILVTGRGWGLGNDKDNLTDKDKLVPVNNSAGYDGKNAKEIYEVFTDFQFPQ